MKRYVQKKHREPDYILAALVILRPPEDMTVSQWAEKNRVLDSRTSARPGMWRNQVTPYLVEIMDTFNDYQIETIVFVKPTQVGGTETILNILGYLIDQDPAATMLIYPNDQLGERVVEKRIEPMLRASPALVEKWDEYGSQKLELRFSGMNVTVTGAGSPTNLASMPIKDLLMDEVDKYPGASRKEADPIKLARERTKSYADTGRKIFITSTPTLRSGQVWVAKEQCDIEKHFFLPCIHCGAEIELEMKYIKWPGKDTGMSDADRAARAVYVCQECGAVITDADKSVMLQNGRWKTVKQVSQTPTSVAFWMNTLYSPFVRWSAIAAEWMEAQRDPSALHNFVNSWLAEPWEEVEMATDADLVLERQTETPAYVVPDWAMLLTGGIDVQHKCVYWTIRAWGVSMTSQNIAHGQAINLDETAKAMNYSYRKRDGSQYLVELCLVDSGDQTDMVYDFCVQNSDWARPCKGASNPMQTHFRVSNVNKATSAACGMQLVLVDTGKYKDMIASRMRRENGPGSWMVYRGCDREYAEMVTAEQKITERDSRGRDKPVWQMKPNCQDNHYLDTEVYAAAVADVLEVRLLGQEEIAPPSAKAPEERLPEENWMEQYDEWT